MADYKLLGQNYTLPDLHAKVTGRSKYAEDHRAEGMVFVKLLVSPMPHARVRSIDTSAAEALPGVEGILTADELPETTAPNESALTNEPHYEGEPILAVAAVDEETASRAIELIEIDLEPLPFVLDQMAKDPGLVVRVDEVSSAPVPLSELGLRLRTRRTLHRGRR